MSSLPNNVVETYNDDDLLLFDFNNGVEDALSIIFQRYSPSVYKTTEKIIKNSNVAEDIVIEAFEKTWIKKITFISLEKLRSYLHVIAANAAKDFLRSQKIRNRIIKKLYLSGDLYEKAVNDTILIEELLSQIISEMETLPQLTCNVIKLYYIEGLSSAEIAVKLGIAPQTARNHKTVGVNLLKKALNDKRTLPLTSHPIK